MGDKKQKFINVYSGGKLKFIASQVMDWVLIVVAFHLNYTLWGSWVVDIFIVVIGMSAAWKFFRPMNFTQAEAIEYFKNLEKETKV